MGNSGSQKTNKKKRAQQQRARTAKRTADGKTKHPERKRRAESKVAFDRDHPTQRTVGK